MKFTHAVVGVLAALFAGPARPTDWVPEIGQGTASCVKWGSGERDMEVVLRAWVLGFLSGAKWVRFENGQVINTDLNPVWAWLDSYCKDHPTEQISAAINKFVSTKSQTKWVEIPDHPNSYVDMYSVHQQKFLIYTGIVGGSVSERPHETYTVTLLTSNDENIEAKEEAIFDCKGRFAVAQQIIANDTTSSKYHSFDQTQTFNVYGVTLSSIVPDSVFDAAQPLVCGRTQ